MVLMVREEVLWVHRFFIPELGSGPIIEITGDQQKHIEKVLRLKAGERIIGFDGSGRDYVIILQGLLKNRLQGEIESWHRNDREPTLEVHLVQGLAKGDKMDTIIQKTVELGVKSVYPLKSRYSVVRLEEETRSDNKIKRWQKTVIEACKQSGRSIIPSVHPALDLDQILAIKARRPGIMLYEKERTSSFRDKLQGKKDEILEQGVFLLIGPEGGFSREEMEQARKAGIETAGLGPRILRTETAAIIAVGITMYEFDQLV